MSEPHTEKASSDESNEYLTCGLSSMQGWRMTQEDAHNSVLNFDDGTSLFAVYDGHGGHEVAAYCAEHLPKFLKEIEAYKNGDIMGALKQAFLEFDNTLTKPEIIAVLKELAGNNDDEDEDDDENVNNLHEEACMPIEELLAKYKSEGGLAKKLMAGGQPVSPYLKPRRGPSSSAAGCSSSSDGPSSSGSGAGCSSSSSSADQVSSSSANVECAGSSNSNEVNSSDDLPDTQSASPDVGSSGDVEVKEEEPASSEVKSDKIVKDEVKTEKDADSAVSSGSGNSKTVQQNGAIDSTVKKEVNGDVNHVKQEDNESSCRNDAVSSSSPSKETLKNGEVSPSQEEAKVKGKGKAKDKSPRPDPEADEVAPKKSKCERPTRISTLQIRNFLKAQSMGMEDDDSDDTEDEEDTTFDGGNADSSDDDVDDDEEEDDDDEEDEEDEDEDDDDEDDSMDEDEEDCGEWREMKEEPGADSGCTAVVALLKGRDLYVANAGDSRCVVCRKGTAIEMSLDHKPEDPLEWKRIMNAGGKVTCDGRVNGGLNLSRAIGDHAYKMNKDLAATEQMITALPDVRTLRINPEEDEFMVLACDGIWNYLSSQDVVDFVRKRIQEGKLKISQICEELFDHCLAPNTLGDGTGCDNMTAVIVQFQPSLSKLPVTLTHDSVFDEPVKNEKADSPEKADSAGEAEAKSKGKLGLDETNEVPSDEVSTSNSLKRAAPSNEVDGSSEVDQPEKKLKTDSDAVAESSATDSEAVAV